MQHRHLIDFNDWGIDEWERILNLTGDILKNPADYSDACKGRILATLFYEPSTRTQMSFQAAILRLGGQYIGFSDPAKSSVAKGESIKDSAKIVSAYADITVIRHPQEGAARAASLYSDCPVINAGDGGHLHPTQTLTDIVTLSQEKGSISGLNVGVCGDLKNGRTVHSLIKALSRYPDNRFYLISVEELSVPKYIKEIMDSKNIEYTEVHSLREAIAELDVLYMTRIQRERFSSYREYARQKGVFILDKAILKEAKKDLAVLHPLPRVDEIEVDVDDDERALYFKQARYGMYGRMALIINMLSGGKYITDNLESVHLDRKCTNPNCVTKSEFYLPDLYIKKGEGSDFDCYYCDYRSVV